MFRHFNKFCWPFKRLFGWALIILGLLLLLLFVPLQLWLALIGSIFVVAGILLVKN